MDAEEAAPAAAELLSEPHPLVATAAAAWHRPGFRTGSLTAWLQGLPAAVETGEMPDQHELDAWTARRTGGLITSFPVQLDPAVVLLLCSVLATRVSWEVPFEVAPAAALGAGSPWSGRLDGVLRAPRHPGHMQFIAATDRAGDVAVHAARASGGCS